jgi:hypothetical protein
MDRRATLFYFAAAVPAVGFVHGPADVNPLDEAMLDSDPEGCFWAGGSRDPRSWRLPLIAPKRTFGGQFAHVRF